VGGSAALVLLIVGGLWWMSASRSQDSQSLYDEAMRAIENDDLRRVRVIIHTMRDVPDAASRLHFLQGKLRLRVGMPELAIGDLQAIVSDQEYSVTARTLLGEAFYRLGRHPQAQQVLQEALALDPSQTDARRWLAASYYDIGAMDLAMEQLAVLSHQVQDDPRPYRLRGLIQKDFEQFEEAIADYRQALSRSPEEAERQAILLELAECLVQQHRYDEATQTLSMAAVSSASLVLQARCAQSAGQPDTQSSLVERALILEPTSLDALLLQAELLLNKDDPTQASLALEKAVEAWPKDFRPRFQLANIYRRLGREREADAHSTEVQRLQKLQEEFTSLHEQAFKDTQNSEIRFRLGEIAVELNKRDLARVWYQAALAINPDHPGARNSLRRLLAN